jgi:hypothetical protein
MAATAACHAQKALGPAQALLAYCAVERHVSCRIAARPLRCPSGRWGRLGHLGAIDMLRGTGPATPGAPAATLS